MTSGIERLEETIAKLEESIDQARAATLAAHEATKDLNRLRKSIREVIATGADELIGTAVQAVVERMDVEKMALQMRDIVLRMTAHEEHFVTVLDKVSEGHPLMAERIIALERAVGIPTLPAPEHRRTA